MLFFSSQIFFVLWSYTKAKKARNAVRFEHLFLWLLKHFFSDHSFVAGRAIETRTTRRAYPAGPDHIHRLQFHDICHTVYHLHFCACRASLCGKKEYSPHFLPSHRLCLTNEPQSSRNFSVQSQAASDDQGKWRKKWIVLNQ